MDFRQSIDFDSFMESESIAASTEEILWSDDDTIIAEQEVVWNEGNSQNNQLGFYKKLIVNSINDVALKF